MTSKYSATQIGANPDHRSPSSESIQTQFKEESKIVLEYMNSKFHPAKKIGHMQVHYPSTADGLGQQRANKLTQDDQKYIPRSLCHDDEERRLNEKINSISEHVTNEFDLNTRKKYQNKQHARASVADKV